MADVNNGKKATQNIERNSALNTGQVSKNVVPHVKISQCNYMTLNEQQHITIL